MDKKFKDGLSLGFSAATTLAIALATADIIYDNKRHVEQGDTCDYAHERISSLGREDMGGYVIIDQVALRECFEPKI